MTAWQKTEDVVSSLSLLTIGSENRLKACLASTLVTGIGSFIHPGVSQQAFALLMLMSARSHRKRHKSTKAKLRLGGGEMTGWISAHLTEDLGSIPSIHILSSFSYNSSSKGFDILFWRHSQVDRQTAGSVQSPFTSTLCPRSAPSVATSGREAQMSPLWESPSAVPLVSYICLSGHQSH